MKSLKLAIRYFSKEALPEYLLGYEYNHAFRQIEFHIQGEVIPLTWREVAAGIWSSLPEAKEEEAK